MQNCLSLYGTGAFVSNVAAGINNGLSCLALHFFAIDACEVVILTTPSRQFSKMAAWTDYVHGSTGLPQT